MLDCVCVCVCVRDCTVDNILARTRTHAHNRLESYERHKSKWYAKPDADGNMENEKELLMKLLPVAFIFMCFVFGASTVCMGEGLVCVCVLVLTCIRL